MTTKKLGNILVKSSIIGAMSLTYAGCGIQAQKQTKESAAENSTDLKKDPTERASLALSLPTNLPAAVDELEVTLDSGITNWVNDPVFTQIFQIKGQAIQINDLEAGDYWITVKLIESNSGRIYSHGEGQATVQAGKDATVHISMTKVDATTGGLVIVLEDDSVPTPEPLPILVPLHLPPQICPLIAMAPVCVVVGKSLVYQVYDYKRLPNSCKFAPLPQFVQQVPNSFCKGLPGSEGLFPSHPIGL
jgi:hypothetical protein